MGMLQALPVAFPWVADAGRRIPGILADIVSILATRQFGTHHKTLCINLPQFYDMKPEATIPTALLRLPKPR